MNNYWPLSYYTADGKEITPGARLFNYYDMVWVTILPENWGDGQSTLDANHPSFDGWFRTTGGLLNGERMSSRDIRVR
jgi:hypothetical protein